MRSSGAILRNVRDQVELLSEHIRGTDPDPDFIATHAAMIMDLAYSLQDEQRREPFSSELLCGFRLM